MKTCQFVAVQIARLNSSELLQLPNVERSVHNKTVTNTLHISSAINPLHPHDLDVIYYFQANLKEFWICPRLRLESWQLKHVR